MDDCFNEIDWVSFLFYLARHNPESICHQLKTDLAAHIAELEAEYIQSLTQSQLEYELLNSGFYTNMNQASFLDNLYYLRDRCVEYKLEDTFLNEEVLKDYWSAIDFTKLLHEYKNQYEV